MLVGSLTEMLLYLLLRYIFSLGRRTDLFFPIEVKSINYKPAFNEGAVCMRLELESGGNAELFGHIIKGEAPVCRTKWFSGHKAIQASMG